MQPKRPGKPGWYLRVLNCASEYGLSFETRGAAEGLGEAQVGQQLGRTLSGHRSPSVAMKGQHAGLDVVLQAGLLDQAAAERSGLPLRHHPPRDVAAEDVQDDVEVEVAPLLRPEKAGDVPGPRFVGRAGP